jgi:hypothetical protein
MSHTKLHYQTQCVVIVGLYVLHNINKTDLKRLDTTKRYKVIFHIRIHVHVMGFLIILVNIRSDSLYKTSTHLSMTSCREMG